MSASQAPNIESLKSVGVSDLAEFIRLDPLAQIREVRIGLDLKIIDQVATEIMQTSVPSLLTSLQIPSSTLTRKLAAGGRLSSGQSDRVSRVILVHAHATDVFENCKLATQWLQTPHPELGECPVTLLDTQSGYDAVQRTLHRIEFGVGV